MRSRPIAVCRRYLFPLTVSDVQMEWIVLREVLFVLIGETHEIQAASLSQPGIVVHVCEDPQNFKKHAKIVPTAAPRALP